MLIDLFCFFTFIYRNMAMGGSFLHANIFYITFVGTPTAIFTNNYIHAVTSTYLQFALKSTAHARSEMDRSISAACASARRLDSSPLRWHSPSHFNLKHRLLLQQQLPPRPRASFLPSLPPPLPLAQSQKTIPGRCHHH